jgi:hypothetical protein
VLVPLPRPPAARKSAAGHVSRDVARDRVPGRVVQGPQRERHEPDYWLLLAAVALSATGILMVYSSSGVAAARGGSIFDAVTTQLTWAIVGGVTLVAAMRADYRYWRRFSVLGIAVAVGLLVLLLLPAVPPLIEPEFKNGATRWLRIGGLPAFHPAEFAKLALVITWRMADHARGGGQLRRGCCLPDRDRPDSRARLRAGPRHQIVLVLWIDILRGRRRRPALLLLVPVGVGAAAWSSCGPTSWSG